MGTQLVTRARRSANEPASSFAKAWSSSVGSRWWVRLCGPRYEPLLGRFLQTRPVGKRRVDGAFARFADHRRRNEELCPGLRMAQECLDRVDVRIVGRDHEHPPRETGIGSLVEVDQLLNGQRPEAQ